MAGISNSVGSGVCARELAREGARDDARDGPREPGLDRSVDDLWRVRFCAESFVVNLEST
jgi:hypothetical protein